MNNITQFRTMPTTYTEKAPPPPKSPKNKDICSLILQFLHEGNLIHSAFCFAHETKIKGDKYLTRGRLLDLVEKGLSFERSNKKQKNQIEKNRSTGESQLNIEKMIGQRVQQELRKLGINASGSQELSQLSSTVSFNRNESAGRESGKGVEEDLLSKNFSGSLNPPVIETPRELKEGEPFFTSQPSNRTESVPKKSTPASSKFVKNYFKEMPDNFFKSSPKPLPRKSIKIPFTASPNSSKTLKASENPAKTKPKIRPPSKNRYPSSNSNRRKNVSNPKTRYVYKRELTFRGSNTRAEEPSNLFKSQRPKSLKQANNNFRMRGSINLELTPSMEEFINSSKYFISDYSELFAPGESLVFENFVFVSDARQRRFGIFSVSADGPSNSIFKEQPRLSQLRRYSLRDKFFHSLPSKVFDQFLIYFTAHQFIAFDYK